MDVVGAGRSRHNRPGAMASRDGQFACGIQGMLDRHGVVGQAVAKDTVVAGADYYGGGRPGQRYTPKALPIPICRRGRCGSRPHNAPAACRGVSEGDHVASPVVADFHSSAGCTRPVSRERSATSPNRCSTTAPTTCVRLPTDPPPGSRSNVQNHPKNMPISSGTWPRPNQYGSGRFRSRGSLNPAGV